MSTLNDTDAIQALMALLARPTCVGIGAPDEEGFVAVFNGMLGVASSTPDSVLLAVAHEGGAEPALVVIPTDAEATIGDHRVTFAVGGISIVIEDLEHATAVLEREG